MTLSIFSRMNERLEGITPKEQVEELSNSLSAFIGDDKALVIQILALEYDVNNIGETRAKTWVAKALGIFDEELDSYIHTWGDIGEAVYELDTGNENDSDITIKQLHRLLSLDCSRINSHSYDLFSEALVMMSAREKKWFLRYWLHKPRNGVHTTIPKKAMASYFGKGVREINKYAQYNSLYEICLDLRVGNTPECKLKHGQFVTPMLAKARKGAEKPDKYIVDIKYDGNRYIIHKKDRHIIIFNRKGNIATDQYPDIVEIVKEFDGDMILDSEIYPINRDGSPAEHKMLGKRVHKKDKAEAVRECPVNLAVFDVLSFNGISFLVETQEVRMKKLLEVVPKEYQTHIFDSDATIQSCYNMAIDWGYEGIMIKDASMIYEAGKRSKGWLKYKPPRIELDVVITSGTYGKGTRTGLFGSFGISVKDGSSYVNVGKVGTGFSDEELLWLTNELRKSIDRMDNGVYYFLPRIVLQVTSDLVTNDADGNIGLRFPRSMRVRHDKFASDVDTIQTVREMML